MNEWESPLIDDLNSKIDQNDPKVLLYASKEIRYGKRSNYKCVNEKIYEVQHPCSSIPTDEEIRNYIKEVQSKAQVNSK